MAYDIWEEVKHSLGKLRGGAGEEGGGGMGEGGRGYSKTILKKEDNFFLS